MITVHKLDHLGAEKLKYEGELFERTEAYVLLEARFALARMELGYVTFNTGDRFVEYFYADRWYNIFLIFNVGDNAFKGWYCNVTRPARLTQTDVWADDLALDLFVKPDGQQTVLDEDEFAGLSLSQGEQEKARAALAELQSLAARRVGPFSQRRVDRFRLLT